jgi:ribonucleotide reductase alpha subunit
MIDEQQEQSIYKSYGRERKELQKSGLVPEWFTTAAFQMFKEKYATNECPDIKSTYERIAKQAASRLPLDDKGKKEWNNKFFNLLWNGWLAPSTPVMANMGAGRGCPVSCSGSYVEDSIYEFYESQKEIAVLSKNGFGTSSYLGSIRPRGSNIAGGGKASGVLPVFKDFVQLSRDVSQGATRRGAWAGYIEIDHDDFWEIANHIQTFPDDANVGWIISDDFIQRLDSGDQDAIARYQRSLKLKMVTGKGYYFFVDKVNRLNPKCYVDNGLDVKASQLCLTGDTKIKVRGKITGLVTTTLQTFNDYLIVNDEVEEWEVWSFNKETKLGEWKRILKTALMFETAKLIKITDDETGKSITCTLDHEVYTKNRGYVKACELKEDDELVIG